MSLGTLASESRVKTFQLVNRKSLPGARGRGQSHRSPAAEALGADLLLAGLALRTPGGLPCEHPALDSAVWTQLPPRRASRRLGTAWGGG